MIRIKYRIGFSRQRRNVKLQDREEMKERGSWRTKKPCSSKRKNLANHTYRLEAYVMSEHNTVLFTAFEGVGVSCGKVKEQKTYKYVRLAVDIFILQPRNRNIFAYAITDMLTHTLSPANTRRSGAK